MGVMMGQERRNKFGFRGKVAAIALGGAAALIALLAVLLCFSPVENVYANALRIVGLEKVPEISSVPSGMSLVWSDEFETDGAPDSAKWDYSLGGNGWGNGELQTYTNKRENSIVKKGTLSIIARNNGGMWTSARMKTQYKGDWTSGYFEVRAKLPTGVGTWPAIWMLPSFDKHGGWPHSGELDIMEHVGYDQDMIHATAHTATFNSRKGTQKNGHSVVRGVSKNFHVYGLEWDPGYLQWYVDGKPFYRFDNPNGTVSEWPFDIPFYLIMNVAIGGGWGGQQGIDKKLKEARMDVDYVRVYQKK